MCELALHELANPSFHRTCAKSRAGHGEFKRYLAPDHADLDILLIVYT